VSKEDKINEMVSEIEHLEHGDWRYLEEIKPTKLEDYGTTQEERFDKRIKEMMLRTSEIKDVVQEFASKFDLEHPKVFTQIKEIVLLKLQLIEIHKKTIAEIKLEKHSNNKNNTKDWLSEERKFSELIIKLIGKIYVAPATKKEENFPDKSILFGSNKYILIDNQSQTQNEQKNIG
jgi:hypothetical protein